MENQIIVEIENITSDSLVALNILMPSDENVDQPAATANADQPVTPESNTQYQEIRALRALQSLNKKVRRNMLSVEQKANNREKDAARKRDIRKSMPLEKKLVLSKAHTSSEKQRRENMPLDQKMGHASVHASSEKQRRENMSLDQKMAHTIRENNRKKNRTREQTLPINKKYAEDKAMQRTIKQGKLTLDQPEDMPEDEYLNSFESNPIAAQVFYVIHSINTSSYFYL